MGQLSSLKSLPNIPKMQRMGMRTPSTQNPTQLLIFSQLSRLSRLAPPLVEFSSTIWFHSSLEAGSSTGGVFSKHLVLFFKWKAREATGSSTGGVFIKHLVLFFTEGCGDCCFLYFWNSPQTSGSTLCWILHWWNSTEPMVLVLFTVNLTFKNILLKLLY